MLGAGEVPNVVALHPALLKRFEQRCERLQQNVARSVEDGDPEAAEAIRDVVESVAVKRDAAKPAGLAVVITGRLEEIAMRDATNRSRVWGTLVAGEGLEPPTYGL